MNIRTILHSPVRTAAVSRDRACLRRVSLCALITGLLVWTGAGLAVAQTTTTASQLGPHECGQKNMSFLFFPSGHGASTQYSFPADPTPHMEVSAGAPYQIDKFLALIRWGQGGFFNGALCTLSTTPSAKVKPMRSVKKQTVKGLLECSFKKNATMAIVPGATSLTLTVVANNESVATIALGATASTARYNSKLCASKPPIA
jgi:hypothetical protein